jgi:hypothetical protein
MATATKQPLTPVAQAGPPAKLLVKAPVAFFPELEQVRVAMQQGPTPYLDFNAITPDDRGRLISALESNEIRQWITNAPEQARELGLGVALTYEGWAIRGSGRAQHVNRNSWTPFFHHVREAEHHLRRAALLDRSDPTPFHALTRTAMALQIPKDDVLRRVRAGCERGATYSLAVTAVRALGPMWSGSPDLAMRTLTEIVNSDRNNDTLSAAVFQLAMECELSKTVLPSRDILLMEQFERWLWIEPDTPDRLCALADATFMARRHSHPRAQMLSQKLNRQYCGMWLYHENAISESEAKAK